MIAFVDPSTSYGWSDPPGALRRRNGAGRAAVLSLAVAAVLLALFGASAPTFLSLGQLSAPSVGDEAPAGAGASIDQDALAAQVSHLYIADPAEPGVLTVSDARYAGRFDASGFTLSPPGESAGGGDGFGVSLRSLARGQDIPVVPGGWTGDGSVARRTVAGGVTEQVTARVGNVEWDVVLDRAPAGAGDLVIEADVTGSPVVGAGSAGATTEGPSWSVQGHTVSMGEIVVKDATGTDLHRAWPTVTPTGVALTVPAWVLAAADYPLTVDPVVSPEYPVTTGTPTALEPELAFDGTNYLVVWADSRASGAPTFPPDTRVYGARLSPSGTRLDGNGFQISNDGAGGAWSPPAVDFDGTNFFVVWDSYGPSCPAGTQVCIRGARVSPAGSVLDPAGIVIASGIGQMYSPDVSFDGTNHLVAYEDYTGAKVDVDISAARVSPAGVVQTPFPVSVAPGYQFAPTVASNGSGGSLIAWEDQRNGGSLLSFGDIYSSRVGSSGGALDPSGVAISVAADGQHMPSVAWNGHRYLVVWEDERVGDQGIYGTRVTPLNTVEDPSGIPIIVDAYLAREPSVAANGSTFLVVWADRRDGANDVVYGRRVPNAGAPLDGTGLVIASGDLDNSRPAVTKGPGSTWGTAYRTGDPPNLMPGLIAMRTVAPK